MKKKIYVGILLALFCVGLFIISFIKQDILLVSLTAFNLGFLADTALVYYFRRKLKVETQEILVLAIEEAKQNFDREVKNVIESLKKLHSEKILEMMKDRNLNN